MAKYAPGEARDWALSSLSGCCGCVMPTFTADFTELDEAAIRHDVAMERELGMSSVLVVSEGGTTVPELRRFTEIVVDEAGDDLVTFIQASQPTEQLTIDAVAMAEEAGIDMVLLCYPQYFYPRTEDDVVAMTRRVAESTGLGTMIFAMNLWNFGRLHPAGFSIDLLDRFVEEIPNVAAIKNEVGIPGAGGISHVFERYGDQVLVTDPMETNMPAWVTNYGMRFMGTSNYEYFGSEIPRLLKALADPESYDEAMRRWWELHPARLANAAVTAEISAGTSTVHRLVWKYQGWLMGMNGGPLRPPHPRINDQQMQRLRSAALASGLPVTDDDDAAFFVGRTGGRR